MKVYALKEIKGFASDTLGRDNDFDITVTEENIKSLQECLDSDSDNKLKLANGNCIRMPLGDQCQIYSNDAFGHRPGGTDILAVVL